MFLNERSNRFLEDICFEREIKGEGEERARKREHVIVQHLRLHNSFILQKFYENPKLIRKVDFIKIVYTQCFGVDGDCRWSEETDMIRARKNIIKCTCVYIEIYKYSDIVSDTQSFLNSCAGVVDSILRPTHDLPSHFCRWDKQYIEVM